MHRRARRDEAERVVDALKSEVRREMRRSARRRTLPVISFDADRRHRVFFDAVTTMVRTYPQRTGAALMIAGGIVELILGVDAERRPLEQLATPLSAT